MSENKNLETNSAINFKLKGLGSILVGIYFIVFAYITQTLLEGFLSDSSMIGMMSIEILEFQFLFLAILFLFLAYLSIFYSSRRSCRKENIKFWNAATRSTFLVSLVLTIIVLGSLFYINLIGKSLLVSATFLLFYGFYLIFFNYRKKPELIILGGISIALAITTYIIPSYWYNALFILGIGHFVYGLILRK